MKQPITTLIYSNKRTYSNQYPFKPLIKTYPLKWMMATPNQNWRSLTQDRLVMQTIKFARPLGPVYWAFLNSIIWMSLERTKKGLKIISRNRETIFSTPEKMRLNTQKMKKKLWTISKIMGDNNRLEYLRWKKQNKWLHRWISLMIKLNCISLDKKMRSKKQLHRCWTKHMHLNCSSNWRPTSAIMTSHITKNLLSCDSRFSSLFMMQTKPREKDSMLMPKWFRMWVLSQISLVL